MVEQSTYWSLACTSLLVLFVVVLYVYLTRTFKYWEKQGVMEIPPSPIIGNFLDLVLFKISIGELFKDFHDKGKGQPYVGFYLLNRPFLLLRDPEIIKHILVKDAHIFPDRHAGPNVTDRLGHSNLLMLKNPAWGVVRPKLSPGFTSGKLKKMFKLFLEVDKDFVRHMDRLDIENTPKIIEMKNLCADYIVDMIGSGMFGLKMNALNTKDAEVRTYTLGTLRYNLFRGVELLSIFFLPHVAKYIQANLFGRKRAAFIGSLLRGALKQRVQSGVKRNDFVDLLLQLEEKHGDEEDINGFKFKGDYLIAQAMFFFIATVEPVSSISSFALYELALQPDIQNKLRKEIREGLEETGGEITYEMLLTLPYLDKVVSETFRKHATLPFLERISIADYKVPNTDLVVPKGTGVYVSLIGLHYDPENYPEPEKFDPERFTAENKQKRHKYSFLPLGAGPHICIGLRISHLIAKLTIVQFIRRYHVSPCKKTTVPLKLDPQVISRTALGGMHLNIQKISDEVN